MSDCKKHDYTLVDSDFGQCPLCKLQSELTRENAYSQDLKNQLAGSRMGFEQLQSELSEAISQLAGAITVNNLKDAEIQRLKEELRLAKVALGHQDAADANWESEAK